MEKCLIVALVMALTIESTNGMRTKQMTANVTQTLDYLLASDRYDKRLRPNFGGSPAIISVNFMIKSMGPVSENDQSFGLDCYFRQHWYDLRLRYQKFPGLEEFSMSWLFLDRVWKPDTYFINGKRSYLHRITVPNKFLRLRHDGFITYSMRLTITASCPMHLRKFPLDAQRCPLVVGSFGYTNKDLVYKWTDETPIVLQAGVEIAQFDLVNISTEAEKDMLRGGLHHSTVRAIFWLKRHTGYFMLQVYVPCGLIVLSSWVSFWIDPDDVAARVALGVTTVLSLTTMGFGGRAQLPKVSYWTALDWFVIICFTSVFSVMIEYAIVNFIDKFKKDVGKIIQRRKEEEEEAKKRETEETESKFKPISFGQKQRSASFSFPTSTPKKEFPTTEAKPGRLSTVVVVHFHRSAAKPKAKSLPNLTSAEKDGKWERREPLQVVLDVQDEAGEDIQLGERQPSRNLLRSIRQAKLFCSKTDLIRLVEGSDPSEKFSRIDVQSRRNFPIVFFLSLVVYSLAFSYYLTDEIPVKESDGGFYK